MNYSPKTLIKIAVEAENEKVVLASFEFIALLQKYNYRSGKMSLKPIEDKVVPRPSIFTTEPFHNFFEEFYVQTKRLIEAGMMRFEERLQDRRYDEEVPALVLSMDDLEIGFKACLIPLTFSAIAFIVEIAIPKVNLAARTIRDTLTAVFVVVALLDFGFIGI